MLRKAMTPIELKTYLDRLLTRNLQISTMIWGAPGIGKSSIGRCCRVLSLFWIFPSFGDQGR